MKSCFILFFQTLSEHQEEVVQCELRLFERKPKSRNFIISFKKKIFKALRREEIERPIFTTAETNNNFLGVLPGEFENLLLCS